MSFNDMNKQLGNAQSKESRIRELSETLLRRGLAMTKESARQLAMSMVETEQKVQERFQEKKENATNYKPSTHDTLGKLNQSYRDAESSARIKDSAGEFRNRALNPKPVAVQVHYDTPHGEITPSMTVSEAAVDRAPISESVNDIPSDDAGADSESSADAISQEEPAHLIEDGAEDLQEISDEEFTQTDDPMELEGDTLIEEDEPVQVEVYHDDQSAEPVQESTEPEVSFGDEGEDLPSQPPVVEQVENSRPEDVAPIVESVEESEGSPMQHGESGQVDESLLAEDAPVEQSEEPQSVNAPVIEGAQEIQTKSDTPLETSNKQVQPTMRQDEMKEVQNSAQPENQTQEWQEPASQNSDVPMAESPESMQAEYSRQEPQEHEEVPVQSQESQEPEEHEQHSMEFQELPQQEYEKSVQQESQVPPQPEPSLAATQNKLNQTETSQPTHEQEPIESDALPNQEHLPEVVQSQQTEPEQSTQAPQEPESETPQVAPEPQEKEREDLAKKHGIDLSNIFNVNK